MMYPYQTSATWDNANGKLTCEIPTVQTATDGSYDKTAAVMYSIGSSTNATLKYANAFLQVHVGTNNIHAITVYGSTALSGKVEITDGGVSAASSGSQKHVTIEADSENGTLRTGGYIIAVKPGVFNDVFIAYKYTDHTAKVKALTGSLTLTAGYCTTISVDFSTGTVRQAKQLWAKGPYFATMNVGQTNEYASVTATSDQYTTENVGGLYNWGMSEVHNFGNYHKYQTDVTSLFGDTDTATKLWGSPWRMPTREELLALRNRSNATMTWCNGNSKKYETTCTLKGYKVVGKDGYVTNSVFLPAAGCGFRGFVKGEGEIGYYWSSTPNDSKRAFRLCLDNYDIYASVSSDYRTLGYSVRAVLK